VVTIDTFSDDLVVVRDNFPTDAGVLDLCVKKYGYEVLLQEADSVHGPFSDDVSNAE